METLKPIAQYGREISVFIQGADKLVLCHLSGSQGKLIPAHTLVGTYGCMARKHHEAKPGDCHDRDVTELNKK